MVTTESQELITYSWQGINVYQNQNSINCKANKRVKSTQILKNVSGAAYPNELLAILGSSGAGKTTLLNVLTFKSGKNLKIEGSRLINNAPVMLKTIASKTAYVDQDDIFFGNLTVKEHLVFHVTLMDPELTKEERLKRVEEVMSELNLTQSQDTRIQGNAWQKGLSGGEARRLSFAAQIITNPSMMFCDEPTSGLDSCTALSLIKSLKNLCLQGKSVVCSVHQPSSEMYSLFDKVLFMAKGQVAFLGRPQEANSFFNQLQMPCPYNYCPADFYVEILSVNPHNQEECLNKLQTIFKEFEKSSLNKPLPFRDSILTRPNKIMDKYFLNAYKSSWWTQFQALLWRSWIILIRNRTSIQVQLCQTIIVSLVTVVFFNRPKYYKDIHGALFVFISQMTVDSMYIAMTTFYSEFSIALRENRNGMYRISVFYWSKCLAEIPIFAMFSILFTSICYYLIGLNHEVSRFFMCLLISICLTNVGISLGHLLICCFSNLHLCLCFESIIVMPLLMTSGMFLNISSLPGYFKWITTINWYRMGYESYVANQWHGVTFNSTFSNGTFYEITGSSILQQMNFDEDNWDNILFLIVISFIFRVVGLLGFLRQALMYRK